jgi:hypothetical protein
MRGWLKEAGEVELISEGGGPGSFVAAEALSVVHCRGLGKTHGFCTQGTMGMGMGTLFITHKKPIPLGGYPWVFTILGNSTN